MVDVGAKEPTDRIAVAIASVVMDPATRHRLFEGDLPKGDALATVRIAAIQGAKKTPDLIPLCHPIAVERVDVDVRQTETGATIEVSVGVHARTGVEMEAVTAASVGALALYDMIKGIDRNAHIASVKLLEKRGGRSGAWKRG